jgi:hypothetical protein
VQQARNGERGLTDGLSLRGGPWLEGKDVFLLEARPMRKTGRARRPRLIHRQGGGTRWEEPDRRADLFPALRFFEQRSQSDIAHETCASARCRSRGLLTRYCCSSCVSIIGRTRKTQSPEAGALRGRTQRGYATGGETWATRSRRLRLPRVLSKIRLSDDLLTGYTDIVAALR